MQMFVLIEKIFRSLLFSISNYRLDTSPDGKNWMKVGRFDKTWQNNIPQSPNIKTWKFPPQTVDLTSSVKGLKDFYLKISLTTGNADNRFCFGGFRVLTADTASSTN